MGITSCTHAHCGDSCHFAIVKAFMVATNFWHQNLLYGSVWGVFYRERKRSICCSARDSWVATVGAFVKVQHAERGWFDSSDFHFRLPSFLSPTIDLPGLSIRSLSLLSTRQVTIKCESRTVYSYHLQNLTSKNACNHTYALMLVQLISTAANNTTLVLHSV